jgi:hypothetical protein
MRSEEQQRFFHAARRVENDEARLQARWPARVRLGAGESDKLYAVLPYAFAEAHRPLAGDDLRRLALACKLLHTATLLRANHGPACDRYAEPAARIAAVQFESHALLARLFGGDPALWNALREIEARLAWALEEENAFRSGRRDAEEFDDDGATAIARAKGGCFVLAVTGVSILAGDERNRDALLQSVALYAEASHVLADLRSWRSDLAAGRPTLTTARLLRASPDGYRAAIAGDVRALAPVLYLGVAHDVVAHALSACDAASRAASDAGCKRWNAYVHLLAQRAGAVRAELPEPGRVKVAS